MVSDSGGGFVAGGAEEGVDALAGGSTTSGAL
jgi:hypothetical protein